MLNHWKRLSSKVVHKNPWWVYMLDTFRIANGTTGEYHYVHTEGSSMIVPVMDDDRVILVNQYRFLCDRESIEFPCGGVKPGHSYIEMARLELEEETGYRAASWKESGEFNPFNGATDEICKVYIARELSYTRSKPETTEEFEVLFARPEEIDTMVIQGKIWDGMTLAAWALVRKLFVNKY